MSPHSQPCPTLPHLPFLAQRPGPRLGPGPVASLLQRFQAWRARRAEWRRGLRAEQAIAGLSVRMLRDIGAPEGLVGQRRWQDEHAAMQRTFWLNPRS